MLLGIDLGGTKIEGIVIESKENSKEVIRHRVDTEEEKGYLQVIKNIEGIASTPNMYLQSIIPPNPCNR